MALTSASVRRPLDDDDDDEIGRDENRPASVFPGEERGSYEGTEDERMKERNGSASDRASERAT